ncbi:MAG: patatin-like phospholipase family protein [Bacteroidota bacterium]
MNKLSPLWSRISHSLPVQLLKQQFQQQKGLLIFWVLLLALVYGGLGKGFGGAYLFLEPEYLGQENFWSNFIIGSALGAFLFAYAITLYIHESYRFPFVAMTQHPFYLFSFNNFLLPGGFLTLFFAQFFQYHLAIQGGFTLLVWEKSLGLLLGICAVFMLSATYFFANKSFIQRFGKKLEKGLAQHQSEKKRQLILDKARDAWKHPQDTTHYLVFPFRFLKVAELKNAPFRSIVKSLSEHHGKLLLMQIATLGFIAGLGLLDTHPRFQIPAGASFLLLFSLIIMIMGAIQFWFQKAGTVTFAVVMALGIGYNHFDLLHDTNQAFGMDYEVCPAEYTDAKLDSLNDDAQLLADRVHTLESLDRWLAHHQAEHGAGSRPKAVFVSASGGGIRSALWTFQALQHLDSLTAGELSEDIRLMTGASGGMFGQSYFRELLMRRQLGESMEMQSPAYRENISKDLLNRITFSVLTDLFLPNRKVSIGAQKYFRETGFAFDDQLATNLPELNQRRLGDYARHEADGLIPNVILTPTILNQGRQLYISASPVSFLTRPNRITDRFASRSKGVEFRRFFAEQAADSVLMTTALRMNATFPLVLPLVELPSEPAMTVMDAGAIDNYGAATAVKYLFEFKDWFAANTSGVVFIQIRDNGRRDPIRKAAAKHPISRLTAPLDGGYYSIVQAKDMQGDYLFEFVHEWYDGLVEVIPIEYPQETSSDPASLSFHLTKLEKANLRKALKTPQNVASFQLIEEIYSPHLLARVE